MEQQSGATQTQRWLDLPNEEEDVFTFQVTQLFEPLVSLHGVLQERLETRQGVEVPPCERARRLGAAAKLWACTCREVGGGKLGELPGHPGPDGVAGKSPGGHLKGCGPNNNNNKKIKPSGAPANDVLAWRTRLELYRRS